ncbi:uncharacterized protein LOC135161007 isoform X2 [Diachasmimorpha longicaudata]|uniref:uncharacterized protein LOC135161007 isoform X2 n=1 Tax=Diachasmimorpha longicaudata TaxID=58733 RepID=UPI0030B8CCAA
MQPVKISELLGLPKSVGKKSERKKLEPMKIKDLLESVSKSCSRSNDRVTRPTFLIPGKGVRRKLYDRSPSPRASRPSICPQKSGTRLSTRVSTLPAKNPSRTTLLPSAKPRQSLFPPQPSKTSIKPRKSFLLPPNSIMKQHIEKTVHEKTILEASLIIDEGDSKDNRPETIKLQRPTVIIRSQSSKKAQKPSKPPPEDLSTTSTDSSSPKILEKSLENKENIPPSVVAATQPLTESKSLQLSAEMLQETLRRVEKMEATVEEIRTSQNRVLQVMEHMYDYFTKNIEKSEKSNGILEAHNGVLDKENISNNRSRRKSKESPVMRRRSARIAERLNDPNDSFSRLEEKLNVKSTGKTMKVVTPGKKTPVHDQFMLRRCKSERALREYLAMKASMSYLETPEAGRLKEMHAVNTPSGKKSLRRSISRKVFDELEDLYSDDIE